MILPDSRSPGGLARRPSLSLVVLLGGALIVAACSDGSGGATGPDGATDTGPDTTVDPAVDGSADMDTGEDGPPRNCTPGNRRCLGDDRAEVCSEASEWEVVECSESQLCWGGSCGDVGTCEPESVDRCVDFNTYEGCNPVGTGTGEFEVPFNLTCIQDGEGARLIPRTCLQGETRCDGEQILERCAPSGLEWEFSTNCFDDDNTTLCDEGNCIPLCEYIEKRDTYVGCEYWAVDLDNAFEIGQDGIPNDAFNAQFAVAISNPGETLAAEITIETIDTVLAAGTVNPGDMQVFELPAAQMDGTTHGFWGYRIISSLPIVAYQFNPLENEGVFSNDATILFPTSSLGTDYWVMSRHQISDNKRSTMTVVATQPGETQVTVHLPEWQLENPLETLSGSDIPSLRGGESLEWTLQQYEVLNIETNKVGADLTGTRVETDRTVAVFGAHEAGSAPNTEACIYRERQDDWVCAWDRETNCEVSPGVPSIELCFNFWTCCAEHLEQQMLPVFAWGREFNAARSFQRREEPDVWRIMSGTDGTEVTLMGIPNDPAEPTRRSWVGDNALDAGEWVEFESFSDFQIFATGPIFVGQFLVGLHNPGPGSPPFNDPMNGDPAFMMLVPREQYRTDYIFLVPAEYAHNFVTIVVPTGLSVTHTDEVETQVFEADRFTPFADGDYSALRVELLNEGYQRLTADEPFGVTVYGYDDDVSYGYPAGLDLKKINR